MTSTVSTATSNIFFSPFNISVDDMLGREALVLLENLSRLMALKMDVE